MNTTRRGLDWPSSCPWFPVPDGFAGRVLTAILIASVIAGAALILWIAADLFLLLFAAILLAILLRTFADAVNGLIHAGRGWSLAIVIVLLAAAFFLAGWQVAPGIGRQFEELADTLPKALEDLRSWLEQLPAASRLFSQFGRLGPAFSRVFETTLGAAANVVVVLVVALYLAANPGMYRNGLVRLFPPARRKRAAEILDQIGDTLRLWLFGRLVGMAFVAAATYVGLKLAGAPTAFALALLAGLLDFVPNIGPIIAAVPAILITLAEDPISALWVALVYAVVQMLEGYIVAPYIEHRVTTLPPALIISGQLFFALLLGALGLLVATPLMAVVLVLVRELYFQDFLGEEV